MSKNIATSLFKKFLKRRLIGKFFACALGVTAVEFALVAPAFFGLTYGVIETGRFFYVKTALQNAVDQSGRFATLNTTADSATIIADVKTHMLDHLADTATFSVSTDTVGTVDFRTVAASYNFQIVLTALPIDDVQISVQARVPLAPE